MALRIREECIMCGACAEICPAACISVEEDIYVIDGNKCTNCKSCVEICPVEAMEEVEEI